MSITEKKKIIIQLDSMVLIDQRYNQMIVDMFKKKKENEKINYERIAEIEKSKIETYKSNSLFCEKIIEKFGFLDNDMVGEKTSDNLWLIIQHSDHNVKLQKKALKLMKEKIKNKKIKLSNYAYLHDRVSKNTRRKYQLFGTQVDRDNTGKYINKPKIKNINKTNQLRAKFGLESLEKYLEIMEL